MATSVARRVPALRRPERGTPFETASTPVIAVQPFENAVSSANVVSSAAPPAGSAPARAAPARCAPVRYRHAPTASMPRMLTMKK